MLIIFLCIQNLMEYEEHEKRAWSVDFSRTEPSMLVSGSDDCKVQKELFLIAQLDIRPFFACILLKYLVKENVFTYE